MTPSLPPGRNAEVAGYFLRLGVTAFGGPAAHISMMHDEVALLFAGGPAVMIVRNLRRTGNRGEAYGEHASPPRKEDDRPLFPVVKLFAGVSAKARPS